MVRPSARQRRGKGKKGGESRTHLVSPIGTGDHNLVALGVIPHPHVLCTLSDLIQHALSEILEIDDLALDVTGDFLRRGRHQRGGFRARRGRRGIVAKGEV